MPLLHCSKCHHEWESVKESDTCSWCKSPSILIEKVTPFEKFVKALLNGEII